jgi:hypothetical protein
MSKDDFKNTPEWKKGHSGEKRVGSLLQQLGWYVIPSYDYSGEDDNKAPKLQGARDSFVVPDLDIAKTGERRWAEVKTKATPSFTKVTGRLEHGIPMRHYRSYQRVQQITGNLVWLFIYEEDTGEVRFGKLDDLEGVKRVYEGDRMSKGGMVFYPRDALRLLAHMKSHTT